MTSQGLLRRISCLAIEKKACEDRIKEIESIQDELIRMYFKAENPGVIK